MNSYMIIQKDISYEKSVINIEIWRELYTEIVNRNSLKYLVYQSIEGTLIYR